MGAYIQASSFLRIVLRHHAPAEQHLHLLLLLHGSRGHAPVAQLNNAPTSKHFVNQTIDRLIFLGRGPPSAVGDGKIIGASWRWSQAALSALPVELWPRVDLVDNGHCAEVACLAPTAANLKDEALGELGALYTLLQKAMAAL